MEAEATEIETREQLTDRLRRRYKGMGFKPADAEPPLLKAVGLHGVHWIGRAVVAEDLDREEFEDELVRLADHRMDVDGERCPLDLVPAADCRERLRELLVKHHLDQRAHISVFTPVR